MRPTAVQALQSGAMIDSVRIDKWLWAARFFKSRSLAQDAVAGGKVHVNGQRVKPAHAVSAGDELAITKGTVQFVVVVDAAADRRGPAKVAETLYTETAESAQRRERLRAERRHRPPAPEHKPDKRLRRRLQRIKEGWF